MVINKNIIKIVISVQLLIVAFIFSSCREKEYLDCVAVGTIYNDGYDDYVSAYIDNDGTAIISIVQNGVKEDDIFVEDATGVYGGAGAVAVIRKDSSVFIIDRFYSQVDYSQLSDVKMMGFTMYLAFILDNNGNVTVIPRNLEKTAMEEKYEEAHTVVERWSNIKYIDVGILEVFAITDEGGILAWNSAIVGDEKLEEVEGAISISTCFESGLVSIDDENEIFYFSSLLGNIDNEIIDNDLKDYLNTFKVKKVAMGHSYMALLSEKGILKVFALSNEKKIMASELLEFDGCELIRDINSYDNNLIILKEDGTVIVLEENTD